MVVSTYCLRQRNTLLPSVLSDISDNDRSNRHFCMQPSSVFSNLEGHYDDGCWCWHLKRNVSIGPSQLALLLAGLACVTLFIGTAFYWVGASFILPFSILEVAALLIAFLYNAIHANDYEKLLVSDGFVKIESKFGMTTQQVQLVRSMTRVDRELHKNTLIQLRQGHQSTFFGRYVHANLRPLLAQQISKRMLSPRHSH